MYRCELYVYMYTQVCIHIYIHPHAYVYTYIHTHTHMKGIDNYGLNKEVRDTSRADIVLFMRYFPTKRRMEGTYTLCVNPSYRVQHRMNMRKGCQFQKSQRVKNMTNREQNCQGSDGILNIERIMDITHIMHNLPNQNFLSSW